MLICALSWASFMALFRMALEVLVVFFTYLKIDGINFVQALARASNNMAEKQENKEFDTYGLFYLLQLPTRK